MGISSTRKKKKKKEVQTASCTLYGKKRAAHDSKIYIYKVLVKPINNHGLESAR